MSSIARERPRQLFTIACVGGPRYVIFHASILGSPDDYRTDKWYVRPIPVVAGFDPGEPFDTAEDAERSARARHAGVGEGPMPDDQNQPP